MFFYVLSSVLWWPLRFRHANYGRLSYLRCLCLFTYGGVQRILCCVFLLMCVVICTLCYKLLWIVNIWLHLLYSLNPYSIVNMLIELLVFFSPLRPITNSDWTNDRWCVASELLVNFPIDSFVYHNVITVMSYINEGQSGHNVNLYDHRRPSTVHVHSLRIPDI